MTDPPERLPSALAHSRALWMETSDPTSPTSPTP
eukprot:CAMPEP_0172170220 /NCGR_PEP_ID=MMETSP1050-20130122/11141_1 /TAXON_ID=233186 /ORGANISM="Cryptomonas curvata, Strain CCAP979/52" /LENGTH=33 /DNA_ID= /DNA_START= /DNA_END= /DNA_ORIENTATION=